MLQKYLEVSNEGLKEAHITNEAIEIGKRIKFIEEVTKINSQMKLIIFECLQDNPRKWPITADLNRKIRNLCEQHPNEHKSIIKISRTIIKVVQ